MIISGASPSFAGLSPETWVDEHGDCLFRYALLRVRREDVAEDLVQETLLAGLKAQTKFAGKSQVRSWLVGILKNKISDYFRKLGREQSFTDLKFAEDDEDERFFSDGHFHDASAPGAWSTYHIEKLDKSAFWKVLTSCIEKLPKRVADVFLLREMEERTTDEVCEILTISQNHLWVMLHRARQALRECLEKNWFGADKKV